MPLYKIKHVTRYSYSSPVIDCTNQLMLYPVANAHVQLHKHEINITSNPEIEMFTDYFENQTGVFSIVKPHRELLIESVAEITVNPIVFPMDEMPAAEQWQHLHNLENNVRFIDFLKPEVFASYNDMKETLSQVINHNDKPLKNALVLSEYVYSNFKYEKGVTNIETKTEEVWKLKAGVCQDFAHVLLVMLRMFNIPARYVSGYICPKQEGVRGEGATHAWVEAYIPFYGWLGLDPTNNCIVSEGHVKLAVGRSFTDCTPVKGTYKGAGEHTLEVSVDIENGDLKNPKETPASPAYVYEVKNPDNNVNSYRIYVEMQQQQ